MKRFKAGLASACAAVAFLPGVLLAAKIPEGTDVRLQVTEKLSSATATEGQRFGLVVDENVVHGGLVLIPKGAKAVGTVMSARKRGHMGKAGELNIQINYLLIGDQRVPLRASSGREGDSKVGATVALTVLFGPLGLLKRGKNVEVNPGVVLTAQVDQTIEVPDGGIANLAGSQPSTTLASSAYDDVSAPAARGELVKLGCTGDFSIFGSSNGRTIFESTCSSGKRQLVECTGNQCRALN